MFDRRHGGILRRRRARDRDQRLAGRVRDEMKVKKTAGAMRHSFGTELWTAGEKAMALGPRQAAPDRCAGTSRGDIHIEANVQPMSAPLLENRAWLNRSG